jgi:NADH-quinone oxidoreductase subunit L
MNPALLVLPILVPVLAGLACLLISDKAKMAKESIAILVTAFELALAIFLFGKEATLSYPWIEAWGISFSLRLYHFSGFICLAAAGFGLLIAIYSAASMRGKPKLRQYYAYLLVTLGMVEGAVLADNLVLFLLFWESLLLMLYGMIAIGGPEKGSKSAAGASKTAVKAFVIAGVTDLCMMVGLILLWTIAKTGTMSAIHLSASGLGGLAFVLLVIGAISKAGSMPFHSWIPDAALDAPLTFMAFVPAALEKLLGIYFLARISLDFFAIEPSSWLSLLLMIVGCCTILLAVGMALVQKNYKKLLSFHAISQVGYMILGIGTAVPVGIVGGLFHMINHAMYKSGLFLTAGSVEKQAGTTDLEKLGGLARKMPVTFGCFIVTAAAISGVPPFNGFFSKELVYDGALERGWIFYAIALLGSFLTAASFLKLGHAAYLGKGSAESEKVKEAPWAMLAPMLVIAALCVLFGVWNYLPINAFIAPIVAGRPDLPARGFAGFPANPLLVAATAIALCLAFGNHYFGFKRTGRGLGAVDHIHYAPGLRQVYAVAEKGILDPYNIGMDGARLFAKLAWWVDRGIDWVQDKGVVELTRLCSSGIRRAHSGKYSRYVLWCLVGAAGILAWMGLSLS